MLTKGRISTIKKLGEKKYRNERKLFVVEGEKSVLELLDSSFVIEEIFGTKIFIGNYDGKIKKRGLKPNILDQGELQLISSLRENHSVIAIAKQPENKIPTIENDEVVIALDGIKDPGNLGTIIRVADWYGIKNIIVSEDSVDVWNSKVIVASMGSFTRVKIFSTNLFGFLEKLKMPVFGATLDGKPLQSIEFPKGGVLLMGSESHGISENVTSLISKKITIPRFGKAESLNVGIATAVILDRWKNI